MDAGSEVVCPVGGATDGALLVGVLVGGAVVVVGGDVVVVVLGGGGRRADCPLGDDEHAAAITVNRTSVPATTSLERARTGSTRGRLS